VYFSGGVNSFALQLLPNGNIAYFLWTGMIHIWSTELEHCVRTIDANAAAFAKLESGHLCTATSKGLVSIWDYLTGAKIKSFQLISLKYNIFAMSMLQDKRICIQSHDYSSDQGCLVIINIDFEECEHEIGVICLCLPHIELTDGKLCTVLRRKITLWG
jgi:WD40 repeat protein